MAKSVLSDLDFNNVTRILNLLDPTLAQHPATKAYVDALIQGLAWKENVRLASTANINLASPGGSLDSVSFNANDTFLAKNQTAPAENGIYVWNGSSTPATRRTDSDSASKLLSAVVSVDEGTSNQYSTWRQDTVAINLGTTAISWVSFGTAPPAAAEGTAGVLQIATQTETNALTDDTKAITPLKLANYVNAKLKNSTTIGDNSSTQIDITHNFATRDLIVYVRKNSGNYDQVICDVSMPDTNTVRLNFSSAPGTNALRVTILG